MSFDSLTSIANQHNFDTSLTVEFDNDQTSATLLTPSSGKSLAIQGVYISTEATTGDVRLFFSDDENDSVNTIYKFYAPDENPGLVPLRVTGDMNSPLKITSTFGATKKYFILINYKED